jgi:2-polyprenyl-3-methyl-5-hydroxy-6-metoxy-1,4-benzoquinol methylase
LTYRIKNTFLPRGYYEHVILKTLEMYCNNEDLTNSPLVIWGREALKRGELWYCDGTPGPDIETFIQQRQKQVIDLLNSIREKGYDGSVITVYFDRDGYIHTYDGYHRLCIMKYLNMEVDLNIEISNIDPDPAKRGDFPLVETLIAVNNGRNVYTPVLDDRVKDFTIWRPDSPKRLEFILSNIRGKTVLDIGCAEGYFSLKLAKRDYEVTALDTSPSYIAITRYLSTINNLKVNCELGAWQDCLNKIEHFDNILFLSVFHHSILSNGLDNAFKQLQRFNGKADRIFFETPLSAQDISWLDEGRETSCNFSFEEEEFKSKLEKETDFKVKKVWYGIRPLFLLETK